MIKENPRSVGGVVIDDGNWYDVGTVEEYNKLRQAENIWALRCKAVAQRIKIYASRLTSCAPCIWTFLKA